MKNNLKILLLCLLLLVVSSITTYGCSSFAVYSNRTLYGMNLDYYPVELRFMISDGYAGRKVFSQNFFYSGNWVYTNGMNDRGVFSNYQEVIDKPYTGEAADIPTLYLYSVVESLGQVDDLQAVEKIMTGKRLVHNPGFPLHSMIASKDGQCLIVEIQSDGTHLIKNDQNFMVMTNFYNSDHLGESWEQIVDVSSIRYQLVYQGIEENMGNFDIMTGFKVLQSALQKITLSTLIFDPENLDIYIALEGDFEHIYKVSMNEETIETYLGFAEEKRVKIGYSGILVSELKTWI